MLKKPIKEYSALYPQNFDNNYYDDCETCNTCNTCSNGGNFECSDQPKGGGW